MVLYRVTQSMLRDWIVNTMKVIRLGLEISIYLSSRNIPPQCIISAALGPTTMSELQKSLTNQKPTSLPSDHPVFPHSSVQDDIEEENDEVAPLPSPSANLEDDSSSASSASSINSAGTIKPNTRQGQTINPDASE